MMGLLLHFQDGGFLAHYAAMQHNPEAPTSGSTNQETTSGVPASVEQRTHRSTTSRPVEIGGREGPEPTRFGDWEKAGRCIDF